MGGLGVSAAEELERRDREERMRWLEQEEVSRASGDPFPTYDRIPQPIPRRYRDAAGLIGTSTGKGRTKRDPAREVELEGGGVPPLGEMDEEEYAEWVRAGMYRLKHRAEAEERERAQRVKEEKERAKKMAKEQVRKEEKKRIERLKAEKSLAEEEKRKKERERYRSRWIRITEVGGEVEESELRYDDVPWPVHPGHEVEKETIRTFLLALAKDDGDDVGGLRKVQREAIRAFHPDRFFGRVLARVREGDREKVKEGVERCSRILNDLAAEHRESGWVTRMES